MCSRHRGARQVMAAAEEELHNAEAVKDGLERHAHQKASRELLRWTYIRN